MSKAGRPTCVATRPLWLDIDGRRGAGHVRVAAIPNADDKFLAIWTLHYALKEVPTLKKHALKICRRWWLLYGPELVVLLPGRFLCVGVEARWELGGNTPPNVDDKPTTLVIHNKVPRHSGSSSC
jgi:hypothetical protein